MKWEVEQRQREIEAQKQQVEMMEQCHHRELDNLQTALQASFDLIIQYRHSVSCFHVSVIYASFKPFTGKIKCLTQNIKVELETVQEELSSTRKDKFMLQAKVGELRNSMKTVLLQNQQLKQDFKQSRLRKVRQLFMP